MQILLQQQHSTALHQRIVQNWRPHFLQNVSVKSFESCYTIVSRYSKLIGLIQIKSIGIKMNVAQTECSLLNHCSAMSQCIHLLCIKILPGSYELIQASPLQRGTLRKHNNREFLSLAPSITCLFPLTGLHGAHASISDGWCKRQELSQSASLRKGASDDHHPSLSQS